MKKVKIKGKLSLDKMTIAKLNEDQTNEVGGRIQILSLGRLCTDNQRCGGLTEGRITDGIWCTGRRCVSTEC